MVWNGNLQVFYRNLEVAKRREAWALLRYLTRSNPLPLFCFGDFNEIINLTKKRGATTKPNCQMEDFKSALEHSQLSDLGFRCPKFNWNNESTDNGFT